jgi:hypothetical protein
MVNYIRRRNQWGVIIVDLGVGDKLLIVIVKYFTMNGKESGAVYQLFMY